MSRTLHTKSKPVTVLFIGGYGRSGSTILELLLDRVPGITSVGECRHLFGRALGDGELCSCGKPLSDCTFWNKVLKRAFPDGFDRKEIQQAVRQFNTMKHLPQLLWPVLRTPRQRREAQIYQSAFKAIYEAVAEVTGSSVIVDTSKYPLHGLFLASLKGIRLKTILLVRDPRAVAYSWQRKRVRPEVHWEKREMPRHSVLRSALAWNVSNHLTQWVRGKHAILQVQRYEDFSAQPVESVVSIASFALDKPVKLDNGIFKDQKHLSHTIAGNPVRLKSKTIKINPDTEWEENMSWSKKLTVTIFSLPQLLRFGYRLRW